LGVRAARWLLRATVRSPARRALSTDRFIAVVRGSFDGGKIAFARPPRDVRVRPMPDLPGEWLEAAGADPALLLFFIHGGGFVGCSRLGYRTLTGSLAAATGARVAALDYPLAPEHPHPAAIDALLGAYRHIRASDPGIRRAFIAGDSAGGNLALAAGLALRGDPHAPDGLILFSPWLDLTGSGESMRNNERSDDVIVLDPQARIARAYAGTRSLDDPAVSPLFADPLGLPRTYVTASSIEMLRDDAVRFAGLARERGVDVSLRLFDGVPHVWQLFRRLPESRASLAEVRAFVHGS
jgi:acetyl esterase/lipase